MDNTMEYKCPNCAAPLIFDSQTQQMKCEYCDNSFTMEQLAEHDKILEADKQEDDLNWAGYEGEELEGLTGYICQSCGAQIAGDGNTAATECVYCGNPVVLAGQMSGVNKPNYVIPFKLDKDAAKKALKGFYKGKPLLPKTFKSENHIDKITGLYVPFWLFDCEADATILFDATTVQTWRSGDYRYTKTSHYNATRSGSIAFDRNPADGSSKMDDAYMDAIEPFDYNDMVDFQSAYLAGYLADKYDVDSESSIPRANLRVKNSTEQLFKDTVTGYHTVTTRNSNVHITNGSIKYAMLPVWVLNTKYHDKMYTFAMNGQTGKLVGKLPVDKGRFLAWLFGLFAGFAAIGNAILLLGGFFR